MLIFRHASVCFTATNRKVKLRGRRHESFIGGGSKGREGRSKRRAATYRDPVYNPLCGTVLQIFSIFTINRPVSATTRIGRGTETERERERERRSERARGRFAKDNRVTVHFAAIT